MGILDIILMFIYFLVIIGVGVIGTKKINSSEGYAVAERNLGFFMYLSCLAAVILGGAATIGTAKLGFLYGISGAWLVIMIGLGTLLLTLLLSKKLFGLNVVTISEMLFKRYNSQTRIMSALVGSIYTAMIVITQVIGMGSIMNVFLDWGMIPSILLGGGIVLLYTLLGGMWSITMTDVVQFCIMTVGIFFIMLPQSLSSAGGWSSLIDHVPASYMNWTSIGWSNIFQYFLLYTLGLLVGQDLWQRTFTGKNLRTVKAGGIGAGIYSIFYAIAITIIGMCAFVVFPNLDNPQNAFAHMVLNVLPTGLMGIVLASVLSALMSTASGTLLASSTLLVNDIIKPALKTTLSDQKSLFLSRLLTLCIGIFVIVCAIWVQDILVALDIAYAILSGAMFFPIVLGFFWKKASSNAAFISMLISTATIVVGLIVKGTTSTQPILYGLLASFISIVVLSYLLPDKNPSLLVNETIDNKKIM
ncbi:sodium:solute symporter [Niallia sp. 03133]|uniref:sodium:solute symporter n=1 Tax=Niallia sp. 03133 TaxID=3458060 RepID=UPI0040445FE9